MADARSWQERAAAYLEPRVAAWVKAPPPIANVRCAMSCHTTLPHALVRSRLGVASPAGDRFRTAIEARVTEMAKHELTPFYGKPGSAKDRESRATEAVLDAVALTMDDLGRGKAPSDITKVAIDEMWKAQRSDGGWDWLDFDIEPWEVRDDWGAAMAGLVARVDDRHPDAVKRLRAFVTNRLADTKRPVVLHDAAAMLWTRIASDDDARRIATKLAARQRPDGGFSIDGLVGRKPGASDGYATALGVLALCSAEGTTKRADVQRGLVWLRTHQLASGAWPARSAHPRSSGRGQRYMQDAATAYAALALTTCR